MNDDKQPIPSYDQLESLFVNNAKLEEIEAHVNRFNPITVMRMESMEIRHSAILAWLLDPHESHGLYDKFLRAFLGAALFHKSDLGSPTALEISQCDLRATVVRREKENIDIFLYNPNHNWAFVIENKINSKQSKGQLTRYIESVKSLFNSSESGLLVRGIFLTLYQEDAHDERYAPIGYDAICQFLPHFIEHESHLISDEVTTFLSHYLEILREAVGDSEQHKKMEHLARQLYRDHRKVLEFVMEHGETTSFEFAAHSLVGEEPEEDQPITIDARNYHFDWTESTYISFLPASWYDGFGGAKFKWEGCEDWWMNLPLIAWIELRRDAEGSSGQLRLYAEVGPLTQYDLRQQLINTIQEAADEAGSKRIKFQNGAADEGKKYSKFLKQNGIAVQDVQDSDEIALAMKTLLKRFSPEFDIIGATLSKFQKFGKSA